MSGIRKFTKLFISLTLACSSYVPSAFSASAGDLTGLVESIGSNSGEMGKEFQRINEIVANFVKAQNKGPASSAEALTVANIRWIPSTGENSNILDGNFAFEVNNSTYITDLQGYYAAKRAADDQWMRSLNLRMANQWMQPYCKNPVGNRVAVRECTSASLMQEETAQKQPVHLNDYIKTVDSI